MVAPRPARGRAPGRVAADGPTSDPQYRLSPHTAMMLNGMTPIGYDPPTPDRPRPTNPFRFGALALDDAFTDREPEIAELAADVRNGQDVVDLRTAAVREVVPRLSASRRSRRRGILVAHVDLMTTPTKERLAEKLAASIHEDIACAADAGTRAALRALPWPADHADDHRRPRRRLAQLQLRRRPPSPRTSTRRWSACSSFPPDRPPIAAAGSLLILDEFQEIVDIDPELPKLMRSVFQEQPEVAHVYLGSKRHMMERIFNDENEPFWRSAKQMELGVIAAGVIRASSSSERFNETGRGSRRGHRPRPRP